MESIMVSAVVVPSRRTSLVRAW